MYFTTIPTSNDLLVYAMSVLTIISSFCNVCNVQVSCNIYAMFPLLGIMSSSSCDVCNISLSAMFLTKLQVNVVREVCVKKFIYCIAVIR